MALTRSPIRRVKEHGQVDLAERFEQLEDHTRDAYASGSKAKADPVAVR